MAVLTVVCTMARFLLRILVVDRVEVMAWDRVSVMARDMVR